MHLSKFVHSKTGKYVMSVLLGFGLACLFRKVCEGKDCMIIHAPPLDEIENKVYKQNNKCYTYKPLSVTCEKGKHFVS